MREKLPNRRSCWTAKDKVGGRTVYASFGEYPDGRLGELWFIASKDHSFENGVLGALARVFSIALQCGAPLDELTSALKGIKFEPNDEHADSVVDWLARLIEKTYLAK